MFSSGASPVDELVQNSPAVTSSESPGRKNPTSRPVSAKMIADQGDQAAPADDALDVVDAVKEVEEGVHGRTTLGQLPGFVTCRTCVTPQFWGRPRMDSGRALSAKLSRIRLPCLSSSLRRSRCSRQSRSSLACGCCRSTSAPSSSASGARRSSWRPGAHCCCRRGIDRARVVDTRTKVIQIPPQEVITRDNISIGVDAVVYADVALADGRRSSRSSSTCRRRCSWRRRRCARSSGSMELDEVLAKRQRDQRRGAHDPRHAHRAVGRRDHRGRDQGHLAARRDEAGDGAPGRGRARAARQGHHVRRRAAGGEQAGEAARLIAAEPAALQLRLYQTLVEVSGEATSTIVLPVPIDLDGRGRWRLERAAHSGHDAERGRAGFERKGEAARGGDGGRSARGRQAKGGGGVAVGRPVRSCAAAVKR